MALRVVTWHNVHRMAEQVGLGALETFSRGVGDARYISAMRAGSAPKRVSAEHSPGLGPLQHRDGASLLAGRPAGWPAVRLAYRQAGPPVAAAIKLQIDAA